MLLVWKVWLCRAVNVKEVSRERRQKVLVGSQRCSVALTRLDPVEGEGIIKLVESVDSTPVNEITPLLGPDLPFYFPSLTIGDDGGC